MVPYLAARLSTGPGCRYRYRRLCLRLGGLRRCWNIARGVENMNWVVVGRSGGLAGTDWAIGGVPYMLVRFQLVQGPFSARRFLGG